jgi:hypothetical protein
MGVVGVLHAAVLSIHAIGRAYASVTGGNKKHGVGGHEIYRKRGLSSGEVVFERCMLPVEDDARRLALVETETIDRSVPAHIPATRLRFQYDNLLGSVCLELSASAQVISYGQRPPTRSDARS